MSSAVLPAYGLDESLLTIEAFGSGLINNTWKVTTEDKEYILQRVNHKVFQQPDAIAHNISLIADYLKEHYPSYRFTAPLASKDGNEMIYLEEEGFFRLFPFVPDSHSKDVVETPEQAYEAAVQFGRFTKLLSGMDVRHLKITIPFFHDLNYRYHQFRDALEHADEQRVKDSKQIIDFLFEYADVVNVYKTIVASPQCKVRVTHHDTKISNVLFNPAGKGICVIDLDTVMPGYFISDVGDMMRTYLCPVSEEESDYAKIMIRDDYYYAIAGGYYSEMKELLTGMEKKYFFYAGQYMIYMQAMRFLTDYLNNDIYYGARYPAHNLVRATNQVVLLKELIKKQKLFEKVIY